MHWSIVGPGSEPPWLTPFVPGDTHEFTHVESLGGRRWDAATASQALALRWKQDLRSARHAVALRGGGGVITAFPRAATLVAGFKAVQRQRFPIVAWNFNLGASHDGLRGIVARRVLGQVHRMMVHARREVDEYSELLGLPRERFVFAHVQKPLIPIEHEEDADRPFALAMGTAQRDYATLLAAVEKLRIPLKVVAGKMALRGMKIPDSVQVLESLDHRECRRLAQVARLSIVPLRAARTAGGQVTVVEAMCMGRPVIATRSVGTEDYVEEGKTGLLVEPASVSSMCHAIERLWEDASLRERLGSAGREFAAEHFADARAGRLLGRLLDEAAASAGG